MAVWFMRWLQGLLCKQSPLLDVDIAVRAGRMRTPISDHRDDAMGARARAHAFANKGAIIQKGLQAVRSVKGAHHHEGRNA